MYFIHSLVNFWDGIGTLNRPINVCVAGLYTEFGVYLNVYSVVHAREKPRLVRSQMQLGREMELTGTREILNTVTARHPLRRAG